MSRPTDREIERLLETVLPPSLAPASETCVDPEEIAAWSEGTLAAAQAVTLEAHLATCARCQALAAALARMESVAAIPAAASPAARVIPFRRRFSPAWLGPLVAAAAATAWFVWFRPIPGGDSGSNVPTATSTVARSEPARDVAGQAPPAAAPAPAADAPPTASADLNAQFRATKAEAAATAPADKKADTKDQLAKLTRQQPEEPKPGQAKEAQANVGAARAAPLPAPPPPPAPAPMPAPLADANRPAPSTAPPAPTQMAQAAAAAPTPRQEPARADEENRLRAAGGVAAGGARRSVIEIASAATRGVQDVAAGRGGGGGGGGGRGGFAESVAAASRWRILDGTNVERSGDAGATWQPASIDLPPGAMLTGGVSPAPRVCWLIGTRGLLRLSTDGVRFQTVTFPVTTDLASIQASSARQATVTTTDGRTFVTSDGGQTWRLQGFSLPSF